MKFNSHTEVEGNYIQGKILNGKFILTHLTSKSGITPPLSVINNFDESQLGNLIGELQGVKDRIFNELNK